MSDRDDLEQLTGDRDPGMVKEQTTSAIYGGLCGAVADVERLAAEIAAMRAARHHVNITCRCGRTFRVSSSVDGCQAVKETSGRPALPRANEPPLTDLLGRSYPGLASATQELLREHTVAVGMPAEMAPLLVLHASASASEASKSGGLSAFERLEAAIGGLRKWLDDNEPEGSIDDLHDVVAAFDAFTSAREPEPAKAPTTTQVAVDLALRSTTRKGGTDAERHADAMALVQAAHLVAGVAGVPLAKLCPLCCHRPDAPDLSPEQHMTAFHGAPPDPDAALRDFMAALPSSQPGAKRGPVEAAFDKLDATIDEHDGAEGITFAADAAGLRQGPGLLAFRGEAPLRDVLTFHADGTIKVGEGVTADEAAAAVVEALRPRFATMIAEERGRYPLRVVTAEPATVCPFRACSEPHVHGPTGERHNAFDKAPSESVLAAGGPGEVVFTTPAPDGAEVQDAIPAHAPRITSTEASDAPPTWFGGPPRAPRCPGHARRPAARPENTTPPTPGPAPACCSRAGEYNGFASGPTSFTCPASCSCHD